MEVKERWIFVLFLLYLILTVALSGERGKETFIEKELSPGEAKEVVGMLQDSRP